MTRNIRREFHCGDARTILQQLPDDSVDCAITSPPYWVSNWSNEHQLERRDQMDWEIQEKSRNGGLMNE